MRSYQHHSSTKTQILSLTDFQAIEFKVGRNDLLVAPLGIVIGVVLEERLLLRRAEAVALGHARVAFQEGAGGQTTGHPLDRHHLALLGHERRLGDLLHEGRGHAYINTIG